MVLDSTLGIWTVFMAFSLVVSGTLVCLGIYFSPEGFVAAAFVKGGAGVVTCPLLVPCENPAGRTSPAPLVIGSPEDSGAFGHPDPQGSCRCLDPNRRVSLAVD